MKPYFDENDAKKVLKSMMGFEKDLAEVYGKWKYDFRENLGRRNALVSMSQEIETAKVLSTKFSGVVSDGAPGKPDIIIKEINAELECKLTSGSKNKGYVSFSLQTDWETICNKKKLDYTYILTDENFEKFCFLFFDGLTPDDFFPPGKGSRGKSRMKKESAMKKCTPLFGNVISKKEEKMKKYQSEIKDANFAYEQDVTSLFERYDSKDRTLQKKLDLLHKRFVKKINKIEKKIDLLQDTSDSFSFDLVTLI